MKKRLHHLCLQYHITPLCILLLAFFSMTGCSRVQDPIQRTSLFFDTYITITIYDANADESLLDGCEKLASFYELCFSPTLEGSDLYKINHSQGKPIQVHTETAELIEDALSYCSMTNGQIDISIEPVSRLWNFSSQAAAKPGEARLPSSEAIYQALEHVDYRNVQVVGSTVALLDPDAQISLGFIAKGYIADAMKTYLLDHGVKSALINLGGNILAVGHKPSTNDAFNIGIQKPFDKTGASLLSLKLSDQSLVSSGIYERYFEVDGQLYHHILNPQTGYPIDNELYGVTILSDSSELGDALSTTCYVLGLEEGKKLIESLEGVEAVFITKNNEIIKTSGLSQ